MVAAALEFSLFPAVGGASFHGRSAGQRFHEVPEKNVFVCFGWGWGGGANPMLGLVQVLFCVMFNIGLRTIEEVSHWARAFSDS